MTTHRRTTKHATDSTSSIIEPKLVFMEDCISLPVFCMPTFYTDKQKTLPDGRAFLPVVKVTLGGVLWLSICCDAHDKVVRLLPCASQAVLGNTVWNNTMLSLNPPGNNAMFGLVFQDDLRFVRLLCPAWASCRSKGPHTVQSSRQGKARQCANQVPTCQPDALRPCGPETEGDGCRYS